MSIIGVDIDGVLADFNRGCVNLVVQMWGDRDINEGVAGTTRPRMFSTLLDTLPELFPPCWHYPQALGYTDEQMAAVWKVIKKSDHFWAELWPLPDASEVCQRLDRLAQEAGLDVYFITDRGGVNAKRQTELWLQRHGMEIPTVILASDKGSVVTALKLDAYIDDRNFNAVGVMAAVRRLGRLTRMYLKDAPYNRRPLLPDVDALPDPKLWDEFRDPGAVVVGGVEEMLRKEGL